MSTDAKLFQRFIANIMAVSAKVKSLASFASLGADWEQKNRDEPGTSS
jgi:hypothetical protein